MFRIHTAVLAFITLAVACLGAPEQRVLVIPLAPFEQKFSEKMSRQIAALEADDALSSLSSWTAIPELPAWVFVERKREIAYIFSRPGVSDDYRYAVILGRKKEVIVVRAGGIGGSYEIFEKPKVPTQSSHPVNIVMSPDGEPTKIPTSKKSARSDTDLSDANLHEKAYELAPIRVQGEFQMSFGFGLKILKDSHSKKVMMMYVDSVNPDSDAAKKGLKTGTRIVAIEGRPVGEFDATFSSGSALNRIFSDRNWGAKVVLEVIPSDSQTTRTITVLERPKKFDPDNWVIERMK